MKWTVLSDNRTQNPSLQTEHGLSILLETDKHCILLDTGASDIFIRNAERLRVGVSAGMTLGIDLSTVGNYQLWLKGLKQVIPIHSFIPAIVLVIRSLLS